MLWQHLQRLIETDMFVPALTLPSYVSVNHIHLAAEPLVRHLHPRDVLCPAPYRSSPTLPLRTLIKTRTFLPIVAFHNKS